MTSSSNLILPSKSLGITGRPDVLELLPCLPWFVVQNQLISRRPPPPVTLWCSEEVLE